MVATTCAAGRPTKHLRLGNVDHRVAWRPRTKGIKLQIRKQPQSESMTTKTQNEEKESMEDWYAGQPLAEEDLARSSPSSTSHQRASSTKSKSKKRITFADTVKSRESFTDFETHESVFSKHPMLLLDSMDELEEEKDPPRKEGQAAEHNSVPYDEKGEWAPMMTSQFPLLNEEKQEDSRSQQEQSTENTGATFKNPKDVQVFQDSKMDVQLCGSKFCPTCQPPRRPRSASTSFVPVENQQPWMPRPLAGTQWWDKKSSSASSSSSLPRASSSTSTMEDCGFWAHQAFVSPLYQYCSSIKPWCWDSFLDGPPLSRTEHDNEKVNRANRASQPRASTGGDTGEAMDGCDVHREPPSFRAAVADTTVYERPLQREPTGKRLSSASSSPPSATTAATTTPYRNGRPWSSDPDHSLLNDGFDFGDLEHSLMYSETTVRSQDDDGDDDDDNDDNEGAGGEPSFERRTTIGTSRSSNPRDPSTSSIVMYSSSEVTVRSASPGYCKGHEVYFERNNPNANISRGAWNERLCLNDESHVHNNRDHDDVYSTALTSSLSSESAPFDGILDDEEKLLLDEQEI